MNKKNCTFPIKKTKEKINIILETTSFRTKLIENLRNEHEITCDNYDQLLNDIPRKRCKVQEMQNLSKYFFSIICIWLDRACKTVQENIIQNVF